MLNRLLLDHVPLKWVIKGYYIQYQNQLAKARDAFERAEAKGEHEYLNLATLEEINHQYPKPIPYQYDDSTLIKRGDERAKSLRALLPRGHRPRTLEVGAQDGVASYALAKHYGAEVTCIDLAPQPAAWVDESMVNFVAGDATELPLEAGQFDLAFSYNSFEHILDPKAALHELLRVVRPGGTIHLDFGPIYYAPKGLHAYDKFLVPYCQLLFAHETLDTYCRNHQLSPLKFRLHQELNGWSIEQYRQLWQEARQQADITHYHEFPALKSLSVISRYPGYLKSKVSSFDNLLIARLIITMVCK